MPFIQERKIRTDDTIGIQVDNTICASTKEFAAEEELESRKFPKKGKGDNTESSVKFNGVELAIIDGSNTLMIRKSEYINKIEILKS